MATDAPDRAERIAALQAARAAIDHELALLAAGDDGAVADAGGTSGADWRSLKDAARICRVHPETMARWAHAHGLGRRIDRVWHIDMTRVRAWREDQPYARLRSDVPSDSASFREMSDATGTAPASEFSPSKDTTT